MIGMMPPQHLNRRAPFATDFSDLTVGVEMIYQTNELWPLPVGAGTRATSHIPTIDGSSNTYGGVKVVCTRSGGSGAQDIPMWERAALQSRSTINALLKVRMVSYFSAPNGQYFGIRFGDNSSSSRYSGFILGPSNLPWYGASFGSTPTFAYTGTGAYSMSLPSSHWMRLNYDGTTASAKMWPDGTAEPTSYLYSWVTNKYDNSIGIMSLAADTTTDGNVELLWFSVTSNGLAPFPVG
jgi:hypothetical protein